MLEQNEKAEKHIKGFKIRSFTIWMMALAVLIYGGMIYMTVQTMNTYDTLVHHVDEYLDGENSAAELQAGSDYLTKQVQMYVTTQDRQYMDAYFTEANETMRREKALRKMESYHISDETYGELKQGLQFSDRLMQQEFYAMRLTAQASGLPVSQLPPEVADVQLLASEANASPAEQLAKAKDLIYGSIYQDRKESIKYHINNFTSQVLDGLKTTQEDSIETMHNSLVQETILLAVMLIVNILIFIIILVMILRPLHISINSMKNNESMEMVGSYEFKYLAFVYNGLCEVRASTEAQLRHKAEHDPLTGIMNREAFTQLKDTLRDNGKPLALALVDVDYFKQVNDNYGHEAGDACLKKVAWLLENSFSSKDFPIRIGGDEFAIILTDVTPEHKDAIEEIIIAINQKLQKPNDDSPPASLSIGIAFSDNGYQNELYHKADQALYKAKEAGRHCCRFYEKKTDK